MYNFSIPMALVDFLPVLFFGYAAALLQQDLYNKMTKGSFALFAAGTINIFAAGFLKATWKLLYAAGICDFHALNTMFLPVQSLGFLLAGMGIVWMVLPKKKVYPDTLDDITSHIEAANMFVSKIFETEKAYIIVCNK